MMPIVAVAVSFGVASLLALVAVRRSLAHQLAAQAALAREVAESEELYRTTVDSLLEGIVIQDEQGRIVRINETARRIIASHMDGATPDAGEGFADFLPEIVDEHGEPLDPENRPVPRALAGESVVGLEVALPSPRGKIWFRCNATATDAVDGRGRLVVLTFSNITEERRMATRIADQERRFRMALEHAPIGMALVSRTGELLTINNALCELTARSRDELEFYGLNALAHPAEKLLGAPELQRLLDDGRDAFNGVRRILAGDGSTVHVRIAMSVVRSADDAEPYFIAEFLDITETLRAEEAQRRALAQEQEVVAKLMALDDARSTFVSTVSHELRTPLTSLVGYLELLEDGTAGALTDEQRQMVAASVRNGERLKLLIDDLLTISAVERPAPGSRSDRVSVDALVSGVVEAMTPLADSAEIALVVDRADVGIDVPGKASELERVLINVVNNAVKFTPAGGTVTIRTCRPRDDTSVVEISVSDTGIGIPEHEQDQLFTRFFRSTSAHQNHVPGTGLGLAIVDKLVQAHAGTIALASIEHVGTTVTIRLPLFTAAASSTAAADDAATPVR